MIVLPAATVEKIQTVVTATIDPTEDTVEWAFPTQGTAPSTWTAGEWDGTASGTAPRIRATAVSPTIGATGSTASVELTAGTVYDMYVRVTDSPEVPVRMVGAVKLI